MPSFGKLAKDFQKCLRSIHSFSDTQAHVLDWDSETLKWLRIQLRPNEGVYKNGMFDFMISFGTTYPYEAPNVTCLTNIYHPNIDPESSEYNVCLSLLDEWQPTFGIEDLIQGLLFLMKNPNLEDPLSSYFDPCMDEEEFVENVQKSMRGEKLNDVQISFMNMCIEIVGSSEHEENKDKEEATIKVCCENESDDSAQNQFKEEISTKDESDDGNTTDDQRDYILETSRSLRMYDSDCDVIIDCKTDLDSSETDIASNILNRSPCTVASDEHQVIDSSEACPASGHSSSEVVEIDVAKGATCVDETKELFEPSANNCQVEHSTDTEGQMSLNVGESPLSNIAKCGEELLPEDKDISDEDGLQTYDCVAGIEKDSIEVRSASPIPTDNNAPNNCDQEEHLNEDSEEIKSASDQILIKNEKQLGVIYQRMLSKVEQIVADLTDEDFIEPDEEDGDDNNSDDEEENEEEEEEQNQDEEESPESVNGFAISRSISKNDRTFGVSRYQGIYPCINGCRYLLTMDPMFDILQSVIFSHVYTFIEGIWCN